MSEAGEDLVRPPGRPPIVNAPQYRARAIELATLLLDDEQILAVLRHEAASGKNGIRNRERDRIWNKLGEDGALDDARAAGRAALIEQLNEVSKGDSGAAVQAAVYLAKREDMLTGLDRDVLRLAKALTNASPAARQKMLDDALATLNGQGG